MENTNSLEFARAERDVLGKIILKNSDISTAREYLQTDDFFYKANQVIFDTMKELDARGDRIELDTIGMALVGNTLFNEVGGVSYLVTISNEAFGVPSIKSPCKTVKEFSTRRKLAKVAQQTLGTLERPDGKFLKCAEYIQSIKDQLDEITQEVAERHYDSLELSAAAAINELEALANGSFKGIMTGFCDLDKLLAGLRPGSVTIIAARPGMGKTAFALNIVMNAALFNKIPSAVFSLEMTKKELAMRVISSISKVDSNAMRNGDLKDKDWEALLYSLNVYHKAPFFIDDTPALSIATLRDRAKRLKQEQNIQLLVVDYLQLMTSASKRVTSREQEVADISRGLKLIAKELDLPVICLSQLNRASETRSDKRPFLSDLRESGSIEQDADNILFIHRDDYYNRDQKNNKAEIIVAKQRSGSTGAVNMIWDGSTTTFKSFQEYEPNW